MTEWEYLYCKLLLVNNLVEGDGGLMMRKCVRKMENVGGKRRHAANKQTDTNVSADEDTKRKKITVSCLNREQVRLG